MGGSILGCVKKIPNIFPSPGFSSDAAISSTAKWKATMLLGTPTMFVDVLGNPALRSGEFDVSSLSHAILGGSPVTPTLAKAAKEELGTQIAVAYGMTETTGASFVTPFGIEDEIALNTVG